jgi:apolipoprotein N-acyltransferase
LAGAAALLPFVNGASNISLAAWLAPVFLLRFVRRESPKVGLLVAYVLLVAAFAFQFRGMVPIPGVGYYIFLFAWGIPSVLPYAVDRFLGRRLPGLTASLVFPAAWAATEYVLSRSPYGSWELAAYSQYGKRTLVPARTSWYCCGQTG